MDKSTPSYTYYHWGPLLFKTKMQQEDLKKCAELCSKTSSKVDETLAGVIKHQHYISPTHYVKILNPYIHPFIEAYRNWYGKVLTQVSIQASWVNFMTAGEFNPPHMHLNCDLSSVLFVKTPEGLKEEHKKFTGTGPGPGALSFTYGEYQLYTISSRSFFPEEGDLFMFPATLTHFVAPFLCKGERISLSANFKLNSYTNV